MNYLINLYKKTSKIIKNLKLVKYYNKFYYLNNFLKKKNLKTF